MIALLRRLLHLPILRFGLVGVGNMLVDIATLEGLHRLFAIDLYSGRVLSFLAAASFGFFVNRKITFAVAGPPRFSEWARFIASQAVGGAVNYAVYAALIATIPVIHDHPALAIAAGAVVGLVFNYLAAARLVFKTKAG